MGGGEVRQALLPAFWKRRRARNRPDTVTASCPQWRGPDSAKAEGTLMAAANGNRRDLGGVIRLTIESALAAASAMDQTFEVILPCCSGWNDALSGHALCFGLQF
jgi:hypothetical protein